MSDDPRAAYHVWHENEGDASTDPAEALVTRGHSPMEAARDHVDDCLEMDLGEFDDALSVRVWVFSDEEQTLHAFRVHLVREAAAGHIEPLPRPATASPPSE